MRVEIDNPATGAKRTATTDQNGHYRFDNVDIGHYRIVVLGPTTPGARAAAPIELDVQAGPPATVNLTWTGTPDGTINTDSVLTGQTVAARTNNANIQHDWNTQLVQNSPQANLVNRNGRAYGPENLSVTSEGVTTGPGPGPGLAVNGQPPYTNNFRINGVDNNNKIDPGPLVYISNEADKSFSMFENQSRPVFGHSTGGKLNDITRTGTNDFHGSIYEYWQNLHLNAVDTSWANQGLLDRPRYDQNRLGGSLGMPILRNRIFFFGNFEYIPLGFQAPVDGPIFAPTAAGFQQLQGIPGISTTNLGILRSSVRNVGPATQTITVAGQSIPAGLVNSLQRGWQNRYAGTGAIDFNIRPEDSLHIRYVHNLIYANNSGPALTPFQTPEGTTALVGTVSEDHVFTPSITNEIRAAYNRWDQSISDRNLLFPSLNAIFPGLSARFPGLSAFPNISIGGTSNLLLAPAGFARSSIFNTYHANDTVGIDRRGHSIRAGADVMRYISAIDRVLPFNGNYLYSDLQRFLFDLSPDVLAQRGFGSSYASDNRTLITAFVQDTWAMRPGLTLDLGVRYWYDTLPSQFTRQELNSASNVPGVITFGKPHTQSRNFAPNVGIAFAPGSSRKTVFRAGFGMMYDALQNLTFLYATPYVPQTGGAFVTSTSPPSTGFLASGGLPNPAAAPGGAFSFHNLSVQQARALTSSFVGEQKLPYSMQWNVGVEASLWRSSALEVKYLGAKDTHLPFMRFVNLVSPVTASQSLPLYYLRPTQAQLNALPLTLGQLAAQPSNTLAQYGFTNPITTISNEASAWYNGLAVNLSQRLGSLSLLGNYTWSHLIDEATGTPLDLALGRQRSSSLWDRRQRAAVTGVFDIAPLFKNTYSVVRNVVANMSISGTYIYQTPVSFPVLSNGNAGLTGYGFGPGIVNRFGSGVSGTGVTPLFNGSGQTVAYLANDPRARFVSAAPGLFAPSGRNNTFQLNPINNLDISVVKRFSYHDRWAVDVRGDAYNIINHPQFTGVPVNSLGFQQISPFSNFVIPGEPGFGNPSLWTTSNPRLLQLALRVTF